MARRARREELLVTCGALFAAKGVAATTMRDIGEAAGVHSGSLYHHFRSKDAIVVEVLEAFLDDVHHRYRAVVRQVDGPAEQVRGLIRETLALIEDHPHATAIYQSDRPYLRERGLLEPLDESSRAARRYWMDAIGAGVADGTFRTDVPPEVFYRALRDALWSTPHWPAPAGRTTAELAELIARLFLDGYTATRGGDARDDDARGGRDSADAP